MKRMMILILFISLSVMNVINAQEVPLKASIWTVDYVKAKEGELGDLVKYYKLNWQAARKHARKANYVEDYQWFVLPENADYQVVLMTKYKDQVQFDRREENFQKIFAKYKPILVNGKGSGDMRVIIKSEEFYEAKFK